MIEGVIFDMDGVLVDNARYHILAWQRLGKEFGADLAAESVRRVFGQRNYEMVTALLGNALSQDDCERLAQRKERIYRDMIAAEIEPVPGLLDFLADLKACGIKAAVGTSGPPENVAMVLTGLRLESYWQSVVTGADVSRSKPAPDIFLLAAERLGFPARHCLVFEDSTAGIEAAHRAGCPCIALSTTHSAAELKSYPALKIVPNFTGLRAAELRSLDGQSKM